MSYRNQELTIIVTGINQNIQPEENRLSWLMGCYFQLHHTWQVIFSVSFPTVDCNVDIFLLQKGKKSNSYFSCWRKSFNPSLVTNKNGRTKCASIIKYSIFYIDGALLAKHTSFLATSCFSQNICGQSITLQRQHWFFVLSQWGEVYLSREWIMLPLEST